MTDITLLTPAKSKKSESTSIKIEDVRLFQSKLSLRPTGIQICLITDIDLITVQAANGLLKTLEEVPPYRIFLATTDNPRILLPTIQSRMILLTTDRESYESLDPILIEHIQAWTPHNTSDLIAACYTTKWEKHSALACIREISRVILRKYPNPRGAQAIAESLSLLHQTNTQPKIAIDRVIIALT